MLNGFVKSDHPRACGENALNKARNKPAHGSPPRMRGKPLRWNGRKTLRRITPAHAGKTLRPLPGTRRTSDHPRACGENEQKHYESNVNTGSPPRMRGKRSGCRRGVGQRRITPAHAGKTDAIITIVVTNWDHPRACGENKGICWRQFHNNGSPPRMRGKPIRRVHDDIVERITPAHAGKTPAPWSQSCANTDHPRACGENFLSSPLWYSIIGSPPRMRGKRTHDRRSL